jgi:hypothetical protein
MPSWNCCWNRSSVIPGECNTHELRVWTPSEIWSVDVCVQNQGLFVVVFISVSRSVCVYVFYMNYRGVAVGVIMDLHVALSVRQKVSR